MSRNTEKPKVNLHFDIGSRWDIIVLSDVSGSHFSFTYVIVLFPAVNQSTSTIRLCVLRNPGIY